MPNIIDVSCDSAITYPPFSVIAPPLFPPSPPSPVTTTPIVRLPQTSADDENIISTEGTYLSSPLLSWSLVITTPLLSLLKERWQPPGAIKTSPPFTSSLSPASLTFILHILFNRSANGFVNPGGICWDTTTLAGNPSGQLGNIAASAGGPPVEIGRAQSELQSR